MVTGSLVVPLLQELKASFPTECELDALHEDDPIDCNFDDQITESVCTADISKQMKATILSYLLEKYNLASMDSEVTVLKIATFLDPRFKDSYYNMQCAITSEYNLSKHDSQTNANALSSSCQSQTTKHARGWDAFFSNRRSIPVSQVTSLQAELNLYISSGPLADKNADPLEWWKTNQNTYPGLAFMAKRYLCVQATSVASERLFSTAGNIVTDRRNSLKPDMVNKLIFLSKNL